MELEPHSKSSHLAIQETIQKINEIIAKTEENCLKKMGLDELQKTITIIDGSLLGYKEKAKDNLDKLRTANRGVLHKYGNCEKQVFELSVSIRGTLDTTIPNLKSLDLGVENKETYWTLTAEALTDGLNSLKTASNNLNGLDGGTLRGHFRQMLQNLDQDRAIRVQRSTENNMNVEGPTEKKKKTEIKEESKELTDYGNRIWNYLSSYYPQGVTQEELGHFMALYESLKKNLEKAIEITDQFIKELEEYKVIFKEIVQLNSSKKKMAKLLVENRDLRDDLIPSLEKLRVTCLSYITLQKASHSKLL
ncbi:uncharacterized protein Dana_GF19535 [Drosophila ananassae]|uniref:Uncharacterized protein n=1 Tax=Drosophila ananassae TaxID=7217 RepID=B3MXX6_DROAN|nr:E3 ubiquitin-protein ligase BRE1 [Drosophila ananassae]EDV38591.2 uncharacterized protein Dana_GF19535 [Drosophila ananassae]